MVHLLTSVIHQYHDFFDNKSDPRVNNWFLMSSPFPTIIISLAYALFMKKIGPKLMENRKPFKLKIVLIVYNAIQVLINCYLFNESLMWITEYSWRCQPVDFSLDPEAVRIAECCWWYFMTKFFEFFDTFFFVLRKKFDHINSLHVIHHGIMPVSVWWGVKFMPGGQSTFFGFLNTFVHIIMYSYYMLAAMGPKIQKYLWWKKYLTLIQIVQFVMVFIHSMQIYFIECDHSKHLMYMTTALAVLFFSLFFNFYKKTYEQEVIQEKTKINVCWPNQSILYESNGKTENYSNSFADNSTDKLRNRTYIDKKLLINNGLTYIYNNNNKYITTL